MNKLSENPKISVLMPAYNREKYIEDSINSVLNQTFTDFELIILDDGSGDSTVEKILAFKDARIKFFKNDINQGIAFSRNKLIAAATGEFLAFLDSDDIALPNRLQVQFDFLKANNDILLTGSASIGINEAGKKLYAKWQFLSPLQTDPKEIQITLLFRNCFIQSSVMINKALFKDEKYDLTFPPNEDYEMWARLAKHSKLCNLKEELVMYRYHAQNITHVTNEEKRFYLFNKIIKDGIKFYFNYEPTENELYINGAWQFYTYKSDYTYLKESSKWLKKMQRINNVQKTFDERIFSRVLKKNWFDRCWHHLNKGNISTPFYFLFFTINFSIKDLIAFSYLGAKSTSLFFKRI